MVIQSERVIDPQSMNKVMEVAKDGYHTISQIQFLLFFHPGGAEGRKTWWNMGSWVVTLPQKSGSLWVARDFVVSSKEDLDEIQKLAMDTMS